MSEAGRRPPRCPRTSSTSRPDEVAANGARLHDESSEQGFTDGGEAHERFGGAAWRTSIPRSALGLRGARTVSDLVPAAAFSAVGWTSRPMPPWDDPELEAWRIKMGTVANGPPIWC